MDEERFSKHYRLSRSAVEAVDRLALSMGINRTAVIELAIREFDAKVDSEAGAISEGHRQQDRQAG